MNDSELAARSFLFLSKGFFTNMPKNKGKGGKNRRRGKNDNDGVKRELVFKEDGQGTRKLLLVRRFVGCYSALDFMN